MTSPVPLTTIPYIYANMPGSRRRPWPYDLYLSTRPAISGGIKLMLEPDKDGNLVSTNTKTLDATAPVDFTYSSANPYRERTSEWAGLYGGFGQAVAPEGEPRRYWYAQKSDLSVDGLWMKGPAFEKHVEQIPTAGANPGEVRQLIFAPAGQSSSGSPPVIRLFAICQNGVFMRMGDNNWVHSLDFSYSSGGTLNLPGGTEPQQAVRFRHRSGAPATAVTDSTLDCLYVAMSAGNLWRFRPISGTGFPGVWEMAGYPTGAAAGPPAYNAPSDVGQARYIERVGDELWVAGDYGVAKCEQDPFVRANWSGPIKVGSTSPFTWIGDQASHITWLQQIDDSLIVFKEDGIYTLDTDGLDHELFPTLRGKNNRKNGRNASVWLDRIWFTYGNQTFAMNAGGQLTADGLEQMLENTSPVKGIWVDGSGHNTWFFYEVYHDSLSNHSFLIKHGTWIEQGTHIPGYGPAQYTGIASGSTGVAQFAESHHGALYDWPKRATCLQVVPGIAENETVYGNDRLYVGFADGTVEWTILPQHSPNPSTDVHCEFTKLDSYVYLPQHHSQFRADNKLWHAITAMGPFLDTSSYVEMQYKTDMGDPGAVWYPVDEPNPKFSLPGQRHDMVSNEVERPIFGRTLLVRVHLLRQLAFTEEDGTVHTDDDTLHMTPVIEGIAIHESIRPAFSREFTFNVKFGSFLPKRDGTVDRRRAFAVQQEVLKVCSMVGPIYLTLPTGVSEEVTIIDYQDQGMARQNVRDHTWTAAVHCIQLRTITEGAPQSQAHTTTGLTYATLEKYTLGELSRVI